MLTNGQAEAFAHEWLAAWNAHDVERILAHYADEVEFHSPRIGEWQGGGAKRLCGREALREYFVRALADDPNLDLRLLRMHTRSRHVVLVHVNANGAIAAEFMQFDAQRKIRHVQVYYAGRGLTEPSSSACP